jgi:hypothetical protein
VSATTTKKVLVARFEKPALPGFIQMPGGLAAEAVELLTPAGSVVRIACQEVKAICFVRDLDGDETWLKHRAFATRPKTPGLWLSLRFRDSDSLEGLVPNDLMQLEPLGFFLIPPDPTFQNQRIFVPRTALSDVQVLGVIGSPLRRRKSKPAATAEEDQLEMFE